MTEQERLLKPEQTAEILGVKKTTLAAWRHRGVGPTFVRLNGNKAIRYPETALEKYKEQLSMR